MQGKKPDPRWEQFEEELDLQGNKIGFKIPNNNFLFRYNEDGGWTDQNGRLYDRDGVLIDDEFEDDIQDDESNDESDVDDDEIVDEFEQMLIEEEEGIIRNKKKAPKPQPTQTVQTTQQPDLDEELKRCIDRLKNNEELRQGLSPSIWIFYKMKSNTYERITPQIEKIQDLNSKNQAIKKNKEKVEERRKQLLAANKWIQGEFLLEYSGTSIDEGLYDRYWYGWVKVSADNFFSTLDEIKKSKEFSLLKSKTLYALKSKFYLKKKMRETIQELKGSLKDVTEDGAVLVKINNLPEQFPISFIIDLIQLTGGQLEDVEDIDIVDDFSATMIAKRRTAELFTNIQGYPHEQKQYIWIEVQDLKRPAKFNDWFNVEVDAEYKVPTRQTADTLMIEYARQGIVKVYEKGEEFRLVVHQSNIKRILMFRGQTLNIVRIVRFEKKA